MTDSSGPAHPSLALWSYRHAEIPSHRGAFPRPPPASCMSKRSARRSPHPCPAGARVEFLHAPTVRTVQTAEALRRGVRSGLGTGRDVQLGAPRVEQAIRNPDLYVAGYRVEMVSALDAVAAQLPDDALTHDELERHPFFSRFLTAPDRVGLWVADDDPPGECGDDVARRFSAWARSMLDTTRQYAHCFVCVTHSGPLRAILRRYVLDRDAGEPEYVEPVELTFGSDGACALALPRHARHGGARA